jgi:hypothetical protein
MEKSGSLSQNHRINKGHKSVSTANGTDFNADLQQRLAADDARYHAAKLGLGEHGTHEGWIKAEEAGAMANTAISPEARHKMISLAAYYRAEKRGFAGNGADDDWLRAETETDALLHDRL